MYPLSTRALGGSESRPPCPVVCGLPVASPRLVDGPRWSPSERRPSGRRSCGPGHTASLLAIRRTRRRQPKGKRNMQHDGPLDPTTAIVAGHGEEFFQRLADEHGEEVAARVRVIAERHEAIEREQALPETSPQRQRMRTDRARGLAAEYQGALATGDRETQQRCRIEAMRMQREDRDLLERYTLRRPRRMRGTPLAITRRTRSRESHRGARGRRRSGAGSRTSSSDPGGSDPAPPSAAPDSDGLPPVAPDRWRLHHRRGIVLLARYVERCDAGWILAEVLTHRDGIPAWQLRLYAPEDIRRVVPSRESDQARPDNGGPNGADL